LPSSILSRIIHENDIIGCSSGHGPVFGSHFYMKDDNKSWVYRHIPKRYEKQLIANKLYLLIDEFE
ncbi:4236_t:CDS:1, partial [Cetraspora pellucida]